MRYTYPVFQVMDIEMESVLPVEDLRTFNVNLTIRG